MSIKQQFKYIKKDINDNLIFAVDKEMCNYKSILTIYEKLRDKYPKSYLSLLKHKNFINLRVSKTDDYELAPNNIYLLELEFRFKKNVVTNRTYINSTIKNTTSRT